VVVDVVVIYDLDHILLDYLSSEDVSNYYYYYYHYYFYYYYYYFKSNSR